MKQVTPNLKQKVLFVTKGISKNFKTVQTRLRQHYNLDVIESNDLVSSSFTTSSSPSISGTTSSLPAGILPIKNKYHDGGEEEYKQALYYDLLVLSISAEEDITSNEANVMKRILLDQGKSILCLGSSSSCSSFYSNTGRYYSSNREAPGVTSTTRTTTKRIINENFLSQFGIQFVSDTVVRTVCSKYLHPKHALISNGILHPSLIYHQPNESPSTDRRHKEMYAAGISSTAGINVTSDEDHQQFVYPFGCSLDVASPAWSILSSGSLSFPFKRPICGVWEDFSKPNTKTMDETENKSNHRGRMLVIGSSDMFADDWVEKESNLHLFDLFVQFLLHDDTISLSRAEMTSKGKNIEDARTVPDIEGLSERVKWCLQEHKPLPQDMNALLHRRNIPSFDSTMIPMISKLYHELSLKNEPLSLIRPDFEVPHPPLQPAIFQPRMIELASPPLDLFDLDDEFAEPKVRLAQLTNKCTTTSEEPMTSSSCYSSTSSSSSSTPAPSQHHDDDDRRDHDEEQDEDLEYYVQQAGIISGLLVREEEEYMDGKAILRKLFFKVSSYNTNNSEPHTARHQTNVATIQPPSQTLII
jgi:intraflagellar transport protein 52